MRSNNYDDALRANRERKRARAAERSTIDPVRSFNEIQEGLKLLRADFPGLEFSVHGRFVNDVVDALSEVLKVEVSNQGTTITSRGARSLSARSTVIARTRTACVRFRDAFNAQGEIDMLRADLRMALQQKQACIDAQLTPAEPRRAEAVAAATAAAEAYDAAVALRPVVEVDHP